MDHAGSRTCSAWCCTAATRGARCRRRCGPCGGALWDGIDVRSVLYVHRGCVPMLDAADGDCLARRRVDASEGNDGSPARRHATTGASLPQEEFQEGATRSAGVTKAHLPGPRIARFVGVAPSFSPTLSYVSVLARSVQFGQCLQWLFDRVGVIWGVIWL